MANELNIGVKFGAEGVPEVTKSITQLTAQLKRFQQGLNNATGVDSIARLNRAILETQTRIQNLQKFTGSAGAAFDKDISIKAKSAGAAILDFSRIVQDAPFAFNNFGSIANNIDPLFLSFQRLREESKRLSLETGKNVTTFSLLKNSLIGGAGIGLAISTVTSVLTLMSQGFFSGGRAAKKASEDLEEFKRVLSGAAGDVARDASRVTTLFNALSSGTLNVDERKKALEELKSINKDFFGSLREEEGLIKNLEIAYDGYLSKVLDIGRAKAIESQLTKLFDQKIQLELSVDPKFLTQTNKTAQQAIGNLRKELKQLGGEVSQEELKNANFFAKGNETLSRRVELQQQILNIERGFNVIQDAGVKATQEQIRNIDLRIAGLSKLQKDTTDFDIKTDKSSKREEDSLKKRLAELERIKDVTKDIFTITNLEEQIFDLKVKITLRDAAKNGISKEEADLAIAGFRNQLTEAFNRESLALEAIPKVKVTNVEMVPLDSGKIESAVAKATGLDKDIPIESDRQVKIRLLGIEFVEAEEQAKAAVQKLKDVIINSTVGALTDTADLFGQTPGSIFSGGGIGESISKAAQGLLNIVGNALQQVGKQIIATSALVATLKKALDNLFGPGGTALGFAVGAALVALGGLMKGIKIPAFAGGVNNFGGGLALVGERGPELVNLPRGSDVIPNHMIGGGAQTVNVIVEGRISGKDLVILGQRQVESNKTTGGGGF